MDVVARMVVRAVEKYNDATLMVYLGAVYSPDPDSPNYSFSEATPFAEMRMAITNKDAWPLFKPGTVLDMTFTKSDVRDK